MPHRTSEYRAGQRSRRLNIPRSRNPYAPGTVKYAHWRSGWDSVFKGARKVRKTFDKPE